MWKSKTWSHCASRAGAKTDTTANADKVAEEQWSQGDERQPPKESSNSLATSLSIVVFKLPLVGSHSSGFEHQRSPHNSIARNNNALPLEPKDLLSSNHVQAEPKDLPSSNHVQANLNVSFPSKHKCKQKLASLIISPTKINPATSGVEPSRGVTLDPPSSPQLKDLPNIHAILQAINSNWLNFFHNFRHARGKFQNLDMSVHNLPDTNKALLFQIQQTPSEDNGFLKKQSDNAVNNNAEDLENVQDSL
ncbi:hypothetical protein SUGI_1076890 [Cryptomeria japonica]|nr:hypothetical protein SUGI_1076890 [Cryptomeria japonica]